MAQSSIIIQSSTSHKPTLSGSVISFTQTGLEYKISTSDISIINLSSLAQYDRITISGSTHNNSTFTVKSSAMDGTYILVEEPVINENAGSTISLAYTGFVTAKQQGDGYYSQVDGIHTVAYHVSAGFDAPTSNFNGKIRMQGSLATAPTEDDWFDIDSTLFQSDSSTTVASYNFTGNFVWVRAKCYNWTSDFSSITKILYNH